ncbi:hypothetical protein E0W68_09720 [Flavobacterium salilacus subsp. salilacus]|uniref:hypothetical protein n=1 Tax=Flavobacterium TaxID=237 RepID=UPI0013C361B1|nr:MULTISPECIES: hypothetical protein [Flavobacterium]KAF2518291.1 hypothetical protein E0W68_09720 [Flavobacterium salilacus subsp. salilacus]MBE1615297.1 hypothetical protein [Flavobacterium sp. SaA2.13]
MAIAIRQVPVLKDKLASGFNKRADANVSKKHSVDFSTQSSIAKKILKNANL